MIVNVGKKGNYIASILNRYEQLLSHNMWSVDHGIVLATSKFKHFPDRKTLCFKLVIVGGLKSLPSMLSSSGHTSSATLSSVLVKCHHGKMVCAFVVSNITIIFRCIDGGLYQKSLDEFDNSFHSNYC